MNSALRDKIPSVEQCYTLLKRYHVPDHIIQHSEMVCKVAVFLAEKLNSHGEHLIIPEIEAAALLHDITKMEGITTRQDHAETGKELLHKHGLKRIGEIALPISEEEIINYSDKRVMHTRVVTLPERFADLQKRYSFRGSDKNTIKRIIALESKTYELENKIFSKLDFIPEDLSSFIVPKNRSTDC
ncbi:MAG: HDIG domain-containing protein [Deltaproteobacteria bacterium]|nr:HDIG domain-containing protein [Deltaproteobacteria bacterium]